MSPTSHLKLLWTRTPMQSLAQRHAAEGQQVTGGQACKSTDVRGEAHPEQPQQSVQTIKGQDRQMPQHAYHQTGVQPWGCVSVQTLLTTARPSLDSPSPQPHVQFWGSPVLT